MPRTLQTEAIVAMLDQQQHAKLRRISELEQAPVAEILRRAIDIIMIFDLSSAMNKASTVTALAKFNFFIGRYQYEYMKNNSKEFKIDTSEWLRRVIEAYLDLKDPTHVLASLDE